MQENLSIFIDIFFTSLLLYIKFIILNFLRSF